jgi:hypothetical protein
LRILVAAAHCQKGQSSKGREKMPIHGIAPRSEKQQQRAPSRSAQNDRLKRRDHRGAGGLGRGQLQLRDASKQQSQSRLEAQEVGNQVEMGIARIESDATLEGDRRNHEISKRECMAARRQLTT